MRQGNQNRFLRVALFLNFGLTLIVTQKSNAQNVEPIPKLKPKPVYADIWRNSPFHRETAPVAKAMQKSFARDYAILGMIKYGDKAVFTLINKKTRETIRVTEEEKNGFQLIEIEQGEGPRDLFITVTKNGVPGRIGYDDVILNTPAPAIAQKQPTEAEVRNLLNQQTNNGNSAGLTQSSATEQSQAANDKTPPRVVLPGVQPKAGSPSGTGTKQAPTPQAKRRVVLPTPK